MSEDVSLAVLDMIFSYWKTQMLRALAVLSIADLLAKGPATLESLTEQTGANKDGLARLLRAAASTGMVGYVDGHYVSTSKLDILRENTPVSLKAMAIAQGAPGHWLPWGAFPDSVMTGEAQSRPHSDTRISIITRAIPMKPVNSSKPCRAHPNSCRVRSYACSRSKARRW